MKSKQIRLLCLLLLAGAVPKGAEARESPYRAENVTRIVQQSISGTVTDEQGVPLPGATVLLKGTTDGVVTDFDGNFIIAAGKGSALVVTYVGYEPREVTLGEEAHISIALKATDTQLDEVVVTALGIKKEKRRVGYAVQEVEGESLQKAIAPNIVESLTGKVAGLTITNSNDFFSDPGIFLRGRRPLIVIDGVPTDTDMWNISPDDIENISVLKAASASALYGSRGINGAVQITLKSGASSQKGVAVSVNSSTTFQGGFIRIPKVQNEYGPGNAGQYSFGTGSAGGGGINDFDYSIWGPRFDGRLIAQYDSPIDPETGERIPTPWVARSTNNLKHFMETGLVSSNNVTVQSNSEKGSLLISNTYKHSKASVPGAKLDINVTRIRGLVNLSDRTSLEGSLQYDYQYSDNRPRSNYGPHSPIYTMAIWGGAHFDVRDLKHIWEPGKEGVRQDFVEHWRYNNPYAMAHAWKKPYTKHDILGYLKLNYKISDKVNAFIRTNLNAWSRTDDEEIAVDMYHYDIPDRGGRYRHSEDNLFESNTNFLITYNDKFFNDDFSVDATLGGNQRFFRYSSSYATTTQLVIPGIFKLDNSVDKVTPESEKFKKGVYSGYASIDLAHKNWFYFGMTGRVDHSSTLPEKNDTFFYPSVYFSTVLSDIFDLPGFINFMKLRTSYAKVGGDFEKDSSGNYIFYDAVNAYETGDRYRNLPVASYPGVIDNPNLEPSFNTSYEYGIEAKFFNNRLGIDFSYYENNYGPGIFTQRFSQTSGYSGIRLNGRTTQRKGIDFSVSAVPVRTDNFSWNMLFNFDRGRDYLTSLPPLPDGSPQEKEGRTPVGGRLYDYWYSEWERSPDGQLVIRENGLPKSTDTYRNIGNTQPDFTASINNTFTYKNVSLNFLLDGRFGGITYDRYERDLWRSGSHPDAVHPERELSNIAYANGEDARTMQIPGVKIVSGEITYDPEGNVLSDTREFAPSDYKVDYQTWASGYKAAWENNVIEKTFIKLREVSLTYTFPSSLLKKTFLDGASVSLVGRNLWYRTKDDTYGDLDTYTMGTGDTDLQMPSQRTYGFNINLNF